MLFFPYKADLEHWRFPLVTLLVCAICMQVYAHQYATGSQLDLDVIEYCSAHGSKEFDLTLGHVAAVNGLDRDSLCLYMLRTSHNDDKPHEMVKRYAFYRKDNSVMFDLTSRLYIKEVFTRNYDSFSEDATDDLTHRLWFSPDDIDVVKMITSVFAHNDIMHLAMNLLFFFAFAATVEMVVGSLSLLGSIVLLATLTNLFYAFMSQMQGVFVPTLGLSGIVFGMMGMFVSFLPLARVRCFLWFFVVFKRFAVPAWLIALAYIGWNIYDWFAYGNDSDVNFIIHIAGAAFGYLIGVSIFRTSKQRYHTAVTARNVNRKYAMASNEK